MKKLFQILPQFEKRGLELMRNLLYSAENMDMVLDGLRKVGLEL